MVLADFFRALLRRWYVLLIGALVTGGLAYGATLISPPVYSARGLILLLPAKDSVGRGGNPFLKMDGLGLPADILVVYYQSSEVENQVIGVEPDAEFQVAIEESTRGPLIAIDVTASTPEATLTTLQFLADSIPQNLDRLQSEVKAPLNSRVTSMPLTMDLEVTKDLSDTFRAVIAATGAGMLGTALVALALDGILLRRRQSGDEAAGESSNESEPEDVIRWDEESAASDWGELVSNESDDQSAAAPITTADTDVESEFVDLPETVTQRRGS